MYAIRSYYDVHLIDHYISVRVIAAAKNRLQLGDIDIAGGQYLGDMRNQALAIRPAGGDNKGFAVV